MEESNQKKRIVKTNVVLNSNTALTKTLCSVLVKYISGNADTIILINPETLKPQTIGKEQVFSILQKDYDRLTNAGYNFEKINTSV